MVNLPRILKVGITASQSGQFQMQGRQALAGLQAWADDVNQAGGLYVGRTDSPRPVSIIHHDDSSRADRVRLLTQRLILEEQVDLTMGPYSSMLAQAAASVTEQYGKVLWNQGGASDSIYQQGYRRVVGILTPASEYLYGLPQMLRESHPEANSLAIVRAATGSFPKMASTGVERQAASLGFKRVLLQEYDPATNDFSTIIDRIQDARPNLLVAVGRIENDLLLARQLVQRRPALGAAVVVAAPIQQFHDALGADVEGFIGPSQWEPGSEYRGDYGPTTSQVLESLQRQSHLPIDYPMVQAYAAGLVAQRCVEEAGSLDEQELRTAADVLDFSTFYGRFKIDPATGRQIGRSVVLVQWQQGRKVIVWPPEQSQGRLVYPWQ
ncbi:MAG: amino acid ABC transporter substrate-binding protein [Chloroflexi bacterium]|nr:amino acid ABC transporter substrate-binding protein [Chloroflexota bacterium]MDA1219997.1 amino acid ABC transporter substrate-binding protein [Chloroflexota bacterium]